MKGAFINKSKIYCPLEKEFKMEPELDMLSEKDKNFTAPQTGAQDQEKHLQEMEKRQNLTNEKAKEINDIVAGADKKLAEFEQKHYTDCKALSKDVLANLRHAIERSSRDDDAEPAKKAAHAYKEIIETITDSSLRFVQSDEAEQKLANYLMDRIKEDPDAKPADIAAMQQIVESDEPNKASKITYADAKIHGRDFGGLRGNSFGNYLPK